MCWLYCDIDKRCCFLYRSEHIWNRHTENIPSLLCCNQVCAAWTCLAFSMWGKSRDTVVTWLLMSHMLWRLCSFIVMPPLIVCHPRRHQPSLTSLHPSLPPSTRVPLSAFEVDSRCTLTHHIFLSSISSFFFTVDDDVLETCRCLSVSVCECECVRETAWFQPTYLLYFRTQGNLLDYKYDSLPLQLYYSAVFPFPLRVCLLMCKLGAYFSVN